MKETSTNTLSIDLLIKHCILEIALLNKLSTEDSKVLLDYYLGLLDESDYDEKKIFKEIRRMYNEHSLVNQKLFDIKNLKSYDVGNFNVNFSSYNQPSYSVDNMNSFDIKIIDVDDGEESQYTGVIPINVNFTEYAKSQEESGGQSKGKQKTLGGHPEAGRLLRWSDNGFMTFLFVIFLSGISSGIVFMIFLNFLAK